MDVHFCRTGQATWERLQGITPLAACWHSLCRHAHDNVLRFILYAGFLQSLNVALTELHIGLGVAKLTGVVVNVLDSQVQLCGSGERVPSHNIMDALVYTPLTGIVYTYTCQVQLLACACAWGGGAGIHSYSTVLLFLLLLTRHLVLLAEAKR